MLLPIILAAVLSTTEKSQQEAKAILDHGIEAAGGLDALKKIENISRTFTGTRFGIGQMMRPDAPYERLPLTLKTVFDYANRRASAESDVTIIGGLRLHSRQIIREGRGVDSINLRTETVTPAPEAPLPITRYPEGLLLAALAQSSTLRRLGDEPGLRGITFATSNGGQVGLFFDSGNGLLVRTELLSTNAVVDSSGEKTLQYVFSDYRTLNGVKIPYRMVSRFRGELWEDMSLTDVTINSALSEALWRPPDGFQSLPAPDRATTAEEVAPGVFMVKAPYNGMFVLFDDHVVVIEASLNESLSRDTMRLIEEKAPGKPIRYVMNSHFHSDHIGGLRAYAARGATIISTPMAEKVIRKFVSGSPAIETVDSKRVLTDGRATIEIYNLAPTPHVAEILIAYLPKEKILYSPDLFDIPQGRIPAASEDTRYFAEKIKKLQLDVATIIPTHGRKGTLEDLNQAVRQP